MYKIVRNNEFIEYIKDILAPFGQITTRVMFGGYGIYKDRVIIGIIAESELYFKADSFTAKYFINLLAHSHLPIIAEIS